MSTPDSRKNIGVLAYEAVSHDDGLEDLSASTQNLLTKLVGTVGEGHFFDLQTHKPIEQGIQMKGYTHNGLRYYFAGPKGVLTSLQVNEMRPAPETGAHLSVEAEYQRQCKFKELEITEKPGLGLVYMAQLRGGYGRLTKFPIMTLDARNIDNPTVLVSYPEKWENEYTNTPATPSHVLVCVESALVYEHQPIGAVQFILPG